MRFCVYVLPSFILLVRCSDLQRRVDFYRCTNAHQVHIIPQKLSSDPKVCPTTQPARPQVHNFDCDLVIMLTMKLFL